MTAEVEPGALRVCLPVPARSGMPDEQVTDGAQGAAALWAVD
ncbi:hypothetical protein OG851_38730 [Streptomyces sp. NBC_00161]